MSKKIRSTSRLSRCATGVEHPAGQLAPRTADEPVHRPVAGVVGHRWSPPSGRAGARRGRPTRWRPASRTGPGPGWRPARTAPAPPPGPAGCRRPAAQQGVDPEPVPQPVQQPRPAQRAGLGEHQPRQPDRPGPVRARPVGGGFGAQQPGQRGDQPLDRGPVELIGPAEGVQHLRPRDVFAAGSHSLWANCRYDTRVPSRFRRVDVRTNTPPDATRAAAAHSHQTVPESCY